MVGGRGCTGKTDTATVQSLYTEPYSTRIHGCAGHQACWVRKHSCTRQEALAGLEGTLSHTIPAGQAVLIHLTGSVGPALLSRLGHPGPAELTLVMLGRMTWWYWRGRPSHTWQANSALLDPHAWPYQTGKPRGWGADLAISYS